MYPRSLASARTCQGLEGKTIGLLENRKYHADSFLRELQQVLVGEYGAKKVVYATKYSYSAPCAVETLDSLINECDVVVHGVAD